MVLAFFSSTAFAEGEKSQVPLADPYILLDNGKYYAYGTHDASGIRCYSSDDLRTWKDEGQALNKANCTETQWFWAPEVYHVGDKYIMYFSANEHLFAATATSPKGPFIQVGSYQMESLIGDEKCIDSHVFFDDNGKAYVFFVRFTDGNCIWQAQLEDDYITPKAGTLRKCFAVSQTWENKMGRVNEGPNVIKIGKKYYLTYSGNDYRSQDYGVGYATTTNIASGTWSKFAGNPILCRFDDLVGTGHHSLFYDKEGILRIVFHSHYSEEKVGDRLMYIGTVIATSTRLMMSNEPIIRPTLSTTAPYSPELINGSRAFQDGGAVTVDLNNDGYQDIVTGGTVNQVQNSAIAMFLPSAHKWNNLTATLPFLVTDSPSLLPCDINNDGKMDIICSGQPAQETSAQQAGIFYGNGAGAFSTAGLTFCHKDGTPCQFDFNIPAAADIIDVDNDGRLDIVLAGKQNVILHNMGWDGGNIKLSVEPFEEEYQFSRAIVQAADLNNDGYQDFVISANVDNTEGQTRFTDVYLNDTLQHGCFVRMNIAETTSSAIKRKSEGGLQLADFSGDGWIDIYLTGAGESSSGESGIRQRIFVNRCLTNPTFTNLANSELLADQYNPLAAVNSSVGVIDWNNDGYYDLLVGGQKGTTVKTSSGQLYLNDGKGRMKRTNLIPGAIGSTITFPDYNGDGRKDFLLVGNCTDPNYLKECPKGNNTILCYNLLPTPSRPDAPTDCEATVNADGSVTLSWKAAETAKPCFTYEVFIQDGLGNLLNCTPSIVGGDNDGIRKINRQGRVGCNLCWTFHPSATGTYQWGVQAIDAAYNGSTFTQGPSFTVEEPDADGLTPEQASRRNTMQYDLLGRKTTSQAHGLHISDGKKTLIR